MNWKKALATRFRQLRGNDPAVLAARPDSGSGKSGAAFGNSQAALQHYLDERLSAHERRLAALLEPASRPTQEDADALRDIIVQGLAGLEKPFNRVGREQFKTNTLFEAQQAQTEETLELLRAAQVRQEAESAALRDQSRAKVEAHRLQMASALLPVLDGLEEALAAGRRLVEIQTPPVPDRPPRAGLFRWSAAPTPPTPTRSETALREAMLAWLAGLELVRERMLEWLAAQEVVPLTTLGRPYDPQQQVAVEVVPAGPDCPPGTVVAEIRRGYRSGDQVLRLAEVTVAR